MPFYCQVYVCTVCSLIYATFYFKFLRIIQSQNINWPSGATCRVFDNFLSFIRNNEIFTDRYFVSLYVSNNEYLRYCISWIIHSNEYKPKWKYCWLISNSSKNLFEQNSPCVLTIVLSSRNAQWYLNNDLVIRSVEKDWGWSVC